MLKNKKIKNTGFLIFHGKHKKRNILSNEKVQAANPHNIRGHNRIRNRSYSGNHNPVF